MHQRLRYYAGICRIGGCFWIENFQQESLKNAKVTWRRPYTAYSALVFACFVGLETSFLLSRVSGLAFGSHVFSGSLSFLLHCVVILKAGTNFLSMLCGSRRMLAFFEKSAAFERASGLPTGLRKRTRGRPWRFARRLGVLVTAVLVYVQNIYVNFGNAWKGGVLAWLLAYQISGAVSYSLFLLYDSLTFVTLRGCCEVLADYLDVQVQTFLERARTRDVRLTFRAPSEVEAVRSTLGEIGDLKKEINDIWQSALVFTSGTLLLSLCFVLYTLFGVDLNLKYVLLSAGYALYESFCFLEIVIASQEMMDQVSDVASSTPIF